MTTLPETETKMTQRINRILSEAGIASRRKADDLIRLGRVMLNGRPLRELGAKAEWGKDSIRVDGKEIPKPAEKIYLMLNKPFGYVSTLSDPQGRPIVTDLLKDIPRVYPVGRLDFDSMGLLLLTNDGDFSFQLTHPKYHVPRTYKVTIQGAMSEKEIDAIKQGIQLEDGFIKASSAAIISRQGGKTLIRLTIAQGRNRIVRRIIEALGYSVVHLVRIGFGALELGNLKVGRYRMLEPEEVNELMETAGQAGRNKGKGKRKKEIGEKREKRGNRKEKRGKADESRVRGFKGSRPFDGTQGRERVERAQGKDKRKNKISSH